MEEKPSPGDKVKYCGDDRQRGAKVLRDNAEGEVIHIVPGTSNACVDFGTSGRWNILFSDLERI
jgi:hypothetical protein